MLHRRDDVTAPECLGDKSGMKRIIAGVAGVLLACTLVACGGEDEPDYAAQAEELCIESVKDRLKDPNSAEFQDVEVRYAGESTPIDVRNEDGTTDKDVQGEYWKVHGEVNARNSLGGMVGFNEFRCEATKREGHEMSVGYVDVDR